MNNFGVIFPGQGSQSIGMLSDLASKYSIVSHVFERASLVVNYDLWNLVQNGTEDELSDTKVTQPALLASSFAIYLVWQEVAKKIPKIFAGHSLGEYSALVCADVINFEDGIKLVELRGKLMQEAVPTGKGGMSAIIGLDDQKIIEICAEVAQGEIVSAVNFNSPGQVVIAGEKNAVERAMEACKKAGAKRALPLPVSVPSHCLLMKPAAERLAEALESIKFHSPKIDFINNIDVKIEHSPENIRNALVRQLYCPVQWTKTIEKISDSGVESLLEFGPGKVLAGLVKRISPSIKCISVNDCASLDEALNQIS